MTWGPIRTRRWGRGLGRAGEIRTYRPRRRLSPAAKGLILAGAAMALPALASAVIRRRVEPPPALRWGRAHRFAGRGGEIVFQEVGPLGDDRLPLVLLHSLGPGHDADEWRAAAERLAETYHVYAPDLPGWGRSHGPAHAPYSAGLYIEAIEDFLAGVVREPAVLVAAGLPAAWATRVAAERPGRVRALALVGPLGLEEGDGAPASGSPFLSRLLRLPGLRETVLDLMTSRSSIDHHLRLEVYAAPERVDAALLDHHYRASHVPRTRAALAAYWTGALAHGVSDALGELGLPVWLAWGRKSAAPKVEAADLWLQRLPEGTAEIDIFESAGALPHAEAPAAFSRALERFIGRIS